MINSVCLYTYMNTRKNKKKDVFLGNSPKFLLKSVEIYP